MNGVIASRLHWPLCPEVTFDTEAGRLRLYSDTINILLSAKRGEDGIIQEKLEETRPGDCNVMVPTN